MIRWYRAVAGALLCLVSSFVYAQCPSTGAACTATISPGSGLTAAIEARSSGQTLCLNPGTYTTATTGLWADGNAFGFGKSGVTVCGLGGSPASVVLQGAASTANDYTVKFFTYAAGTPSNMTLANVTITGPGGIMLWDATGGGRVSGVTLKDIVVNSALVAGSSIHSAGVLLQKADNNVIDNVTVTSQSNGFFMIDATGTVMMNSKVNNTIDDFTSGIAVFGGSNNTFVNNTIGNPKTTGTYPIPGDAVNFYNTIGNRFENNTVQGFRDNGIDVHATSLTGTLPAGQDQQNSTDNYLGKNTVVGTGQADGRSAGAAIWSNCGSNRSWIFGNDAQGVPECGTCVYSSTSNVVLGNNLHNNGITGFLVSGGNEVLPFCPIAAYKVKPVNTFVQSNAAFFNKLDETFFRSADNTLVARNFMSPNNGFGGGLRPEPCATASCQSAITFDAATGNSSSGYALNASGARIVANTNHNNLLGISIDNTFTTGVEFAYNRWIQPSGSTTYNRYIGGSGTQNWDGGSQTTGGNFWTLFPGANGNPGNVPYSGVYSDLSNSTGRIVDRFPYKNEDFGKGSTVTVSEPLSPGAGSSIAIGTKRVVRWYSPGCVYNDISLDGSTTLLANVPNTGYAVVTIPSTTLAAHNIVVSCKSSAGSTLATGATSNFNVTANTLQLMAPGRDDMFDAGSTINVAWKKSSPATAVTVQLSTNGGSTFGTSYGPFSGTSARIALPAGAAVSRAVIRITGGGTTDTMDGTFGIRGTSPGFSNVPGGRQFKQGEMERLEWSSPAGSRLVTLQATVGGTTKTVATDLPDRGSFDWIVPEYPSGGVLTLTATYKDSAGTQVGSPVTNGSGAVVGPTSITFSGVPALLQPGTSTTITATASSGATVTLTSATPSICTVSGTTVTAVGGANGTCTINATAPAVGAFAAGSNSVSFTVSADPPRLGNISTRMQVLTGNNVMIAGFVIGGSAAKTIAIQAIGPALAGAGITNYLADPALTLVRSSDGVTIASNDNWQSATNASAIQASGFAPSNALESAILVTLPPGAYTAIVSGSAGTTGVGLVGVYEVDHPEVPLVNISTRGLVLTGNDVMIAGFVVNGSGSQTVVIQGIGPSLAAAGISNFLANPALMLVRSSDGAVLATNDDWQSASNASAIQAAGFAPGNASESAIMATLPPGAYTAVLSGVGSTTGVGIIGVYTTP